MFIKLWKWKIEEYKIIQLSCIQSIQNKADELNREKKKKFTKCQSPYPSLGACINPIDTTGYLIFFHVVAVIWGRVYSWGCSIYTQLALYPSQIRKVEAFVLLLRVCTRKKIVCHVAIVLYCVCTISLWLSFGKLYTGASTIACFYSSLFSSLYLC